MRIASSCLPNVTSKRLYHHGAFAQLLEDTAVGELLRNHRALSYMEEAELREQRDSPRPEDAFSRGYSGVFAYSL